MTTTAKPLDHIIDWVNDITELDHTQLLEFAIKAQDASHVSLVWMEQAGRAVVLHDGSLSDAQIAQAIAQEFEGNLGLEVDESETTEIHTQPEEDENGMMAIVVIHPETDIEHPQIHQGIMNHGACERMVERMDGPRAVVGLKVVFTPFWIHPPEGDVAEANAFTFTKRTSGWDCRTADVSARGWLSLGSAS